MVNDFERPTVFPIPVAEFVADGYGTAVGREAFQRMDAVLRERAERIVKLDLRGARVSASCAREAVGNLIKKYLPNRVFFIVGDLTEAVREEVGYALQALDLSVLYRPTTGRYGVLGVPLKAHLKETLDVVEKRGTLTAKEVAARIGGMTLPATNNRLRDLSDAGLILKLDGTAASGGKEYLYAPLR